MLSCSNELELARKYPKKATALWISQSGDAIGAGVTGLITELQKCATAVATLPVSSELRLVRNLNPVFKSSDIFFEEITFYAIDALVTGGTDQDPAVYTEIRNTLSSSTERYMQSAYRYGMPGNWDPNFFNPIVKIKGGGNIGDLEFTTAQSESTSQDLMIGYPLPHCITVNREIDAQLTGISIYAHLAQYISEQTRYQMYPIKAIAKLRYR